MAVEFIEGFEEWAALTSGGPPEWTLFSATLSTGQVRTGTHAMTNNSGAAMSLTLPGSAKKTIGFGYYLISGGLANVANAPVQICTDTGATAHLTVNFDTAGHITLRRGGTSGSIIATSTQLFDVTVWRYIEVQATIADSGGRCVVRVDGVTWIDYTGDTRNAGTSVLIDTFKFGGQGIAQNFWDDMYVLNDTDDTSVTGRPDTDFLGDVKVETLLPNGDGASLQWTPSTGTTHSTLVDEPLPANTTDYVSSATDGQRDLWTLSDLSAGAAQVFAVRSGMYAAKSDAGAASIKQLVRENSGTVTAETTAQPVSTTYAAYWGTLRRGKPGGGAWSVADVNALQVGVEKAT